MKKALVVLVVLLSAALAGCSTHSSNDLFKVPPVPLGNETVLNGSQNITVRVINPSANNTNGTTYRQPPVNWTQERLVGGRVGWGYQTIHPLIIITRDGNVTHQYWVNKTVNTTHDVLRIIYHQSKVYINGTQMYINNTYFKILKVVTIGKNVSVKFTRWWKPWWIKELKEHGLWH